MVAFRKLVRAGAVVSLVTTLIWAIFVCLLFVVLFHRAQAGCASGWGRDG